MNSGWSNTDLVEFISRKFRELQEQLDEIKEELKEIKNDNKEGLQES